VETLRGTNFRKLGSWQETSLLAHADQVLSTGRTVKGEAELTTTFGVHLRLSYQMCAVEVEGDRHLLLVAEDVTAQRKREESWIRRQKRLEELHDIAQQIAGETAVSAVMQTTIDRACALVKADLGAIVRIDPETGRPGEVYKSAGTDMDFPPDVQVAGRGVLGRIAAGHVIHCDDVEREEHFTGLPPWHPAVGPMIGVPLCDHGRIHAILMMGRTRGSEAFSAGGACIRAVRRAGRAQRTSRGAGAHRCPDRPRQPPIL
jgi:hypothetical protein